MPRDDRKARERHRERDRERDRDRDRERDRERERERERPSDRDRIRDRDRERERERERDRERERERERDRERAREKERLLRREKDRTPRSSRGGSGGRDRRSRSREKDRRAGSSGRGGGSSSYWGGGPGGGGRRGGGGNSSWQRGGGVNNSGLSSSTRKAYRFDSPPREDGSDAAGTGTSAGLGVASATSAAAALAAIPRAAAALSSVLAAGGSAALTSPLGASPLATSSVGTIGSVSATASAGAVCPSLLQLDPAATKAARELYVGNLPPNVEVPQLLEFLNAAMAAVGGALLPGPPAVKAWRSSDGHYAFVEFRTMEEASNAMQLNGLNCMGFNLRIGRPKTYPLELQHIVPPPTIPLLHPSGNVAGVVANAIAGSGATGPSSLGGGVGSVALDPRAALAAAQAAAGQAASPSETKGGYFATKAMIT